MNIKAILFDVDGTLINSEPLSQLTLCQTYKDYGVEITSKDIVPFCGQTDEYIFSSFNTRFGITADIPKQIERREYLYDSQAKDILEKINGASAFVKSCKAAGLKIAVATGATKNHLMSNLKALDLSLEDFDAVVCGSDVKASKPNPETYLKAAKGVGIDPTKCFVFEDSDNGHRSAKAAGCLSIGILSTFTEETQVACGASAVMNDFTEFPSFNDVESFNRACESVINDFRQRKQK